VTADEPGAPGAVADGPYPGGVVEIPPVLAEFAARSAAQMSAENFPVALRLLPHQPRARLAQVYAYARFVDDVGDEAPGDRLALLDIVEQQVLALRTGRPRLAPVAALLPLVVEHGLPIQPLLDLIEANRVDQHTVRYPSFDALLGYCRLSAAPVGQLVLHIAGRANAANIADSDVVCAALQVLEHCQDVGEDARSGRIYLPGGELAAAGVPEDGLLAVTTAPPLRRVVAAQVARAEDMLRAGRPLVRRLSGWARLAVAGYVAGGIATAEALRAADYEVLARHVGPSKARTAVHAARIALGL
jgi:squalene synthase HpnC